MASNNNKVRNLAVTIVISICLAIIGTFTYYDYVEKQNKKVRDEELPEEPAAENTPLRAEWLLTLVRAHEAELRENIRAQLPEGATADFTESRFYVTDTANGMVAYTGRGVTGMHTTTPGRFNFLYALQVNGNQVTIALKNVW